jgi:hypothetical protein
MCGFKSGESPQMGKVIQLTSHDLKRKRQRGFTSFSQEIIEKCGRFGNALGGDGNVLGQKGVAGSH